MAAAIRYHSANTGGVVKVTEDSSSSETNAAGITDALLAKLREWKVDVSKWRGKGFDGACTMSGHTSGVTTSIQQTSPQVKTL